MKEVVIPYNHQGREYYENTKSQNGMEHNSVQVRIINQDITNVQDIKDANGKKNDKHDAQRILRISHVRAFVGFQFFRLAIIAFQQFDPHHDENDDDHNQTNPSLDETQVQVLDTFFMLDSSEFRKRFTPIEFGGEVFTDCSQDRQKQSKTPQGILKPMVNHVAHEYGMENEHVSGHESDNDFVEEQGAEKYVGVQVRESQVVVVVQGAPSEIADADDGLTDQSGHNEVHQSLVKKRLHAY